ncbi:MAG: hypothetical protein J07HQW1_02338 [Haloquadratum walsbyi J07HQW1]|jgi:hypothetical protein|uniref:Uncharacterized protein n=1 Tax=Haloquadratum walsbyi J07HQW1 TaxID=1238424 RepID=U1PFB0_9EURY|nr:MAG: hypothetical protein J07HQW1_02338 [Haloquadratum walsbyi J07HQW1]
MPRPKDAFETLYPYQLYKPAEILDAELMYTVDEIARLLQGLDPGADLPSETEERVVAWTIPWLMAHADELVINDPVGDEPGYFGLRRETQTASVPDNADA